MWLLNAEAQEAPIADLVTKTAKDLTDLLIPDGRNRRACCQKLCSACEKNFQRPPCSRTRSKLGVPVVFAATLLLQENDRLQERNKSSKN